MIRFSLPMLPPSENNAYDNIPLVKVRGRVVGGGGRRLTEEGRAFKREATNWFARHHTSELQFFKKNTPYAVHCIFFFEQLINKGYPKKTDTRYKKIDGINHTKLLLDTIAELTGCDDSTYWDVVVSKREGAIERVDIDYWDLETEEVCIVLGKGR